MSYAEPERFLFIGTTNTDAAVSKLKARKARYVQKRLESGVRNWRTIEQLIILPSMRGVLAKLTATNYWAMVDQEFRAAATRIFDALATKPHLLFVHEAILNNENPLSEDESLAAYGDTYFNYVVNRGDRLTPPRPEVVANINGLLEQRGIQITPYRTNAELSILTAAFIDDNERNLLFRVYVPAGRMYAAEADRLLNLFREWLGQIGSGTVRQDGYATAAGRVYEFFGDDALAAHGLSAQLDNFSRFLDQCVANPEDAQRSLEQQGIDRTYAAQLVARYGKEVQRLQLDLRQSREIGIVRIKQSLESEILESSLAAEHSGDLSRLIESMIPPAFNRQIAGYALASPAPSASAASVTVNINQQVLHAAEATVVQNIEGTVHFGPAARELLSLVKEFGDTRASALESDVHELEDADAHPEARLAARQRLKAFLLRVGSHVEAAVLNSAQTYLETKLGHML